MVEQMKAQYDAFIWPIITISIVIRQHSVVCLKVRNTGPSSAKRVKLTLDRDFYQFAHRGDENNLRNFDLFKKEIPSLSPGEEIFVFLAQGFELNKEIDGKVLTPYEFTIAARFYYGNKSTQTSHEVDLRPYLRTLQDSGELIDPLKKISDEIAKLSKS
jgi:hypothetical protein